MLGVVASPDGSEWIRASIEGSAHDAASLGESLGNTLLNMGARRILDAVYNQ
jgi:hydroxymethylbilane synthase